MPADLELFGGTLMSPVVDPYTVYRRLRREQPVIRVEGLLGRDHLVTRYDDVLAILKNPTLFSSHANARGAGLVMGRTSSRKSRPTARSSIWRSRKRCDGRPPYSMCRAKRRRPRPSPGSISQPASWCPQPWDQPTVTSVTSRIQIDSTCIVVSTTISPSDWDRTSVPARTWRAPSPASRWAHSSTGYRIFGSTPRSDRRWSGWPCARLTGCPCSSIRRAQSNAIIVPVTHLGGSWTIEEKSSL
jgi:hypothetical protein